MIKLFKDLYGYRELLKTNIKKEIRGKYKGAWLGVIWSFLNPLLMLAVYSIIFPYLLRVQVDNYTIFLIVALIPWTFFTTIIQQGCGCIVVNGDILKKVYFPREIIPISIVTSGLVNFLISTVIMLLFVIFGGVGLSWHIIFFPIIVLVQYVFMLGLTFILSSITVYVRDIDHFVSIIMLVLFYATPIVYTPSLIPVSLQWIININPMSHIIGAYRDVLYSHQLPNLLNLGIVGLVAIFLFLIGLSIFRKLQKGFAEEL